MEMYHGLNSRHTYSLQGKGIQGGAILNRPSAFPVGTSATGHNSASSYKYKRRCETALLQTLRSFLSF